MKRRLSAVCGLAALLVTSAVAAQPAPTEGDFSVADFALASGAALPALRMHYRTLGEPRRGADGRIENAVLILHGTGGTGAQFLSPQFAGALFGPGQPLDTGRYYVILPDNLGHGGSSKPSDGLRARFPEYGYADMVEAQRRLLVDGLGVDRLRLIMGTSMGCMHIFVWAETHPDFAEALMPMACQPTAIVGRNRLWRTMLKDAIRSDPAWAGGDYASQPVEGLRTAVDLLLLAGSAPMAMQQDLPTPASVDEWLSAQQARRIPALDANDLWYQVNASFDYDPSAGLERITAPMTWINSADDFINPPELGLAEQFIPRIAGVRYRLVPNSPDGKGHGTHTWAVFWTQDLIDLLARSAD
ncbi:MAG: alpha/beta fold hydrolase [Alphaproteobacteria bacterium]|nr:alpha/beta fold hydrolase [Alphaproteobacteria bacterium]MBU2042547.1 alpha/beta fold hydrolase [Alphaproteobacteria bacterium]MBU2125654.1 alpha/beta fold hydrolase [Alphaproteobacteria bacterium]MBU2209918.1 alpha/beta fold hydrolase [Alphaproteobacteria bacterium]MBU2290642.1 alpha/beta fold hydrolase [Alphaproteobacteria bacterium]